MGVGSNLRDYGQRQAGGHGVAEGLIRVAAGCGQGFQRRQDLQPALHRQRSTGNSAMANELGKYQVIDPVGQRTQRRDLAIYVSLGQFVSTHAVCVLTVPFSF